MWVKKMWVHAGCDQRLRGSMLCVTRCCVVCADAVWYEQMQHRVMRSGKHARSGASPSTIKRARKKHGCWYMPAIMRSLASHAITCVTCDHMRHIRSHASHPITCSWPWPAFLHCSAPSAFAPRRERAHRSPAHFCHRSPARVCGLRASRACGVVKTASSWKQTLLV